MKTYTVHGHIARRDGRSEAFWTRTGLSKDAAGKIAREQRAEPGGVARVVPEGGSKSTAHHARKKPPAVKTYTVHGHIMRRDGRYEAFWTRTGLSKEAAGKIAREQRAEPGGVARVVPEGGSKAQLDREIAAVLGGPRGRRSHATKASNEGRVDNLFAVEIDKSEFTGDHDLPTDAKWRADLIPLAEAELSRGRTYRRPKNARYAVIEWSGFRGAVGRLLEWMEAAPGITRYAEIFE